MFKNANGKHIGLRTLWTVANFNKALLPEEAIRIWSSSWVIAQIMIQIIRNEPGSLPR